MSITYSADVFCDNCGDWTHGITSAKPSGMVRPARKQAMSKGWSYDPKGDLKDLCPDCLEKYRRGEL